MDNLKGRAAKVQIYDKKIGQLELVLIHQTVIENERTDAVTKKHANKQTNKRRPPGKSLKGSIMP